MSTDSLPRNRRSSRRSNATIDQSVLLSSSPPATIRYAESRPSLEPRPTTSSTESTSSNPFDAVISTPSRAASPTSPPCETPLPSLENLAPEAWLVAQSLDDLTRANPTRRRKQALVDGTPTKSPKSADAPLRVSRRRPSSKTSGLAVGQEPCVQPLGFHLTAADGAAHRQRASSAPTPRSSRKKSLDLEQLPVPGRYESQSSDAAMERNSESEQVIPSIILNQNGRDDRSARHSASGFDKDDDEIGDKSYQPSNADTSAPHECFIDDIAGLPSSPFRPYVCQMHHPMVRVVKDERSINDDIRNFILKEYGTLVGNQSEGKKKPGYVYIAESEEYGPEKLKIGQTRKTPDKRIKKLRECRLELKEISDKHQNPLYHHLFLEKVVHMELVNQRLKLKCSHRNGGVHEFGEWFEIDRQRALGVVEKWRNWLLIQRPFDADGKLTPYWQWRAGKLENKIADVKWEEWSQPWSYDYHVFRIEAHFDRSRKDIHFYMTSIVVAFLSFLGHGAMGMFWACVFLMLL